MQLKQAILYVQLPETKAGSQYEFLLLYMCRRREASYKELQQRHERHQNLAEMAGSTILQRAIMVSCGNSLCCEHPAPDLVFNALGQIRQ